MLEAIRGRRSWVTQRIANRYPPWSKLRKFAQSVGQQILEPMGRELEDFYWWANYNLGNYLLNSSDVNQLENLFRLDLPATFEFRTRQEADSVVFLIPTSIRANTGTGWVTLSQAINNSLEEFWYGVPTRITTTDDSYNYRSIVSNINVSNLPTVVPNSIPFPSKLWITLNGNGSSVKTYNGKSVRSSVSITGRDIHNNEITEKVYFAFNGTVQTKFAWLEITSVLTEYVDSTAYLQIDWLPIGQSDYLDLYGLNVSRDREKFRFWSLSSQSYGSTLQHKVFSADSLTLVEDGNDEKHAEFETELLDSSGNNITGLSLCPWPKRRWITVTDGSTVHFFVPDIRMESLEPIVEATTEAVVQIELKEEWVTKNQTITLDYNMKRPFVRVLRTRWSVKKPDGSLVGIDQEGTEITYSSDGWVDHPEGTRFQQVGFQGDYIDYTVNQRGQYVFYLESMITDILTSEGQSRPTTHVDVRVLHSSYDIAQASLSLPSSVGIASRVAFDSYGRPWVISNTGTVQRLEFHYDTYMADFKNKAIFVREEYTDLEVEA